MKRIVSLISLFFPLTLLSAAEVKNVVLPGDVFGKGWELTQPNLSGLSASPNYINRARTDQPVVMINIIPFPSATAAKARMQQKFSTPEAKQLVKKLGGYPEAYEQTYQTHRKRFVLIGHYWLTVEQIGDKDDRGVFIEKYTEHLKKFTKR